MKKNCKLDVIDAIWHLGGEVYRDHKFDIVGCSLIYGWVFYSKNVKFKIIKIEAHFTLGYHQIFFKYIGTFIISSSRIQS